MYQLRKKCKENLTFSKHIIFGYIYDIMKITSIVLQETYTSECGFWNGVVAYNKADFFFKILNLCDGLSLNNIGGNSMTVKLPSNYSSFALI